MLAGNSGYQITDCDLLGTAIIIHTGTHGASSGSPARYGYIARNILWNANAAHWFDGIKEVIFEYNEIKPGGASPSWGNNVDTYAGARIAYFCAVLYTTNDHSAKTGSGQT